MCFLFFFSGLLASVEWKPNFICSGKIFVALVHPFIGHGLVKEPEKKDKESQSFVKNSVAFAGRFSVNRFSSDCFFSFIDRSRQTWSVSDSDYVVAALCSNPSIQLRFWREKREQSFGIEGLAHLRCKLEFLFLLLLFRWELALILLVSELWRFDKMVSAAKSASWFDFFFSFQ